MVNIIVRKGSKKDRLRQRYNNLSSYIKHELQGSSPVKGAVYDFQEWSGTKTKNNLLGTDKNNARMKEKDELKKDLKRKEIL